MKKLSIYIKSLVLAASAVLLAACVDIQALIGEQQNNPSVTTLTDNQQSQTTKSERPDYSKYINIWPTYRVTAKFTPSEWEFIEKDSAKNYCTVTRIYSDQIFSCVNDKGEANTYALAHFTTINKQQAAEAAKFLTDTILNKRVLVSKTLYDKLNYPAVFVYVDQSPLAYHILKQAVMLTEKSKDSSRLQMIYDASLISCVNSKGIFSKAKERYPDIDARREACKSVIK